MVSRLSVQILVIALVVMALVFLFALAYRVTASHQRSTKFRFSLRDCWYYHEGKKLQIEGGSIVVTGDSPNIKELLEEQMVSNNESCLFVNHNDVAQGSPSLRLEVISRPATLENITSYLFLRLSKKIKGLSELRLRDSFYSASHKKVRASDYLHFE